VTIPQQSSNCKFFRLVQGPVVYCALQLRDEYLLSLSDNTINTYGDVSWRRWGWRPTRN